MLYRTILQRAFEGKSSPRQAIKAKCLDCTLFQREEIANCPAPSCPLYLLRPYQSPAPRVEGVEAKETGSVA